MGLNHPWMLWARGGSASRAHRIKIKLFQELRISVDTLIIPEGMRVVDFIPAKTHYPELRFILNGKKLLFREWWTALKDGDRLTRMK